MADEEQPGFGTLVVIVDRARNIPNRKTLGKQDVYAIVRLGHEVQRTPTDKRAGQVPAWNYEIRFKVPSESENILKISVFNENSKSPDLIGDCSVDLSALYKKHEFDSWIDLKYKDKPAGEIYVELTFYYTGAPKPKPKIPIQQQALPNPLPNHSSFTGEPISASTRDTARDRRESMPRQTLSPVAGMLNYDPSKAMSNLSIRPYPSSTDLRGSGYVKSPYQPDVLYADTWDGNRDDRYIRPAPGDVRRKSFSAMSRPDDRLLYADDRDRSNSSLGYNQDARLGVLRAQPRQNYDPSRRNSYDPRALPSDMRAASPRYSPDRRTPVRGFAQESEPVYVEPILDPRHGSPYEPRHTTRIVSPLPEYASGFHHASEVSRPRSPYTRQDFDHPTYDRRQSPNYIESRQHGRPPMESGHQFADNRRQSPTYAGFQQQQQRYSPIRSPQHEPYEPPSQYRGHSQAQSYSQPPRQYNQDYDQGPTSHIKSASTSYAPSSTVSNSGHPTYRYQPPQSPGDLRAQATREDQASSYANNGNSPATPANMHYQVQVPESYAPTPAQYTTATRPLPTAPNAAPSKPAKIPLGLTQEEYDILYGRA